MTARGRAMIVRLVAPAAVGPLVAFGILYGLDRGASYASPWRGPGWTDVPRVEGLAAVERWRADRDRERQERAALLRDLTSDKMVELGKRIVLGEQGLCLSCHTVGEHPGGSQGPDLGDIGERAGDRVEGMTAFDYLAQSLRRPGAYIVEGFAPGMVPVTDPPIALDDDEILWVVAYLQSRGGQVTVTPQTELGK